MVTQVTKRQEGAKDLFGLEFLSFFPGRGWGGGVYILEVKTMV